MTQIHRRNYVTFRLHVMYGSKDHYTNILKMNISRKKNNTVSFDLLSCTFFFIVNTHCTKLHFDSLFWQNAEKKSTSVSFSIRYKYITFAIYSNSVLGYGRSSNACKERYNKYFTLKMWGEIDVLTMCTKSRLNVREGKCKEEKPRTEGNEDI